MIKRLLSTKLAAFLKLFPVVAVVGPRQAGKTTFVKNELRQWRYFDLEKPSDYNKLRPDVEYFFQEYGKHCIVDEVQEIPAIFSYLRSFIDSNRRKKGQIVLLGSVNPLLLKEISESLTGRIGLIELSTLTYSEIHNNVKMNLEDFWLKGGYPEPLKWTLNNHVIWVEQYIKSLVERDILRYHQVTLSAQKQIQLMTMVAHVHGKHWNASEIASAFGISYHTVNSYVDILEKYFLVRRLYPYFTNVGKRLVKHPKLYYRDTGILHYLLGINSKEELRTSPHRGFSFEGLIIENIIKGMHASKKSSPEFYFYRTAQGDEIDLLVKESNDLTAYEIKTSTTVTKSDLSGFQRCIEQLGVSRGIVIYSGRDNYSLSHNIEVKSANDFLAGKF